MSMPSLGLAAGACITPREIEILNGIIKNDFTLRASKPRLADGDTKYVWRMVAFQISPKPKHHGLPVGAIFDLSDEYFRDVEHRKWLDNLADRIVNTVPMQQWHGVRRWSHALGAF